MAEMGECSLKGATLSDATAIKEYGIDRDFIVRGIRSGKLEYRQNVAHGNPYLRLLRGQLEADIQTELGSDRLKSEIKQAELKKIKSRINALNKELKQLIARRDELSHESVRRGDRLPMWTRSGRSHVEGTRQECPSYFARPSAIASNNPSQVASRAVTVMGNPISLAAAAVIGLMAARWID